MEQLSFHLEVFDGPLELLLTLVGKKKIEVWDIHIQDILEQYMAYLERMRQMDMEIASEFLTMAAQLLYIKSRMLLPRLEEGDEEEDPRAELARSLQLYQLAKERAEQLSQRYESCGTAFVRQPEPLSAVELPAEDGSFGLSQLKEALEEVLRRNRRKLPPPVQSFSGIVGRERVPVSQKIGSILTSLARYGIMRTRSLFGSARSRSEIVATFLAVLELSKNNRIHISQVQEDGSFLESQMELAPREESLQREENDLAQMGQTVHV
ncbi:MAG: segregation and condensation protein A [Eubacteriales bacterium]|jgi:segregation and condensation protein A